MTDLLKAAGCCNTVSVHCEIIHDKKFDIVDLKEIADQVHGSIKKDPGTGTVTYVNTDGFGLCFIAYEDFLNQLESAGKIQKGLKRCDFIVYPSQNKKLFLLNELSKGVNPSNKRTTAKQQLHATIQWLFNNAQIRRFIGQFSEKKGVFSYKTTNPAIPHNDKGKNLANPFFKVQELLPQEIDINYQPIEKYGFTCKETCFITI